MARIPPPDFVPVEHDTFLDIVTNVVGILIILVMLVGLQARDVPPAVASSRTTADLSGQFSSAAALEREVVEVRAEAQRLAATVAQRQQERQYMATLRADTERQLAAYRGSLDAQAREKFDLQRKLAAATARIDELDRRRIQAAAAEGPVIEVKNYPTPLGKSVFGREIHFQLHGGRVAHVPIKELMETAIDQARQKFWKFEGQSEVSEVVEPIDGFRMRYTLEKVEMSSIPGAPGRRGTAIRGKRWELIPVDSALGEPLSTALADGSRMNQILAGFDPAQTTVTLWTYPDSFGAFRQLEAELYRRGFATAGRPLPEGISIGGSPNGTRSSAE